MSDDDKLRQRLRDIEIDLERLRGEIGPPTDDPQDFGDAGQDIALRNEQQALIDNLEQERTRIQQELEDKN
jgi:hypothetical protein